MQETINCMTLHPQSGTLIIRVLNEEVKQYIVCTELYIYIYIYLCTRATVSVHNLHTLHNLLTFMMILLRNGGKCCYHGTSREEYYC